MPYRFQRHEPVEEAIRRIAGEQVTRAIEAARQPDIDSAIHEIRTRCKKIRGLLRLVRPHFDAYEDENQAIRDAARLLSPSRDATVRLVAFEHLVERHQLNGGAMAPLRTCLCAEREQDVRGALQEKQALAEVTQRLAELRHRAESWSITASGFHAVESGLKQEYRASRNAMRTAAEQPTVESLHHWRKHAKHHWHHLTLLRRIWKQEMSARRRASSQLADALGEDHDLAILAEHLAPRAKEHATQLVLHHLDHRRSELQHQAHQLGRLVFAEKSGRFTDRMRAYWRAWVEQ